MVNAKNVKIILEYNQIEKVVKRINARDEPSLFLQVFVESAKITQFLIQMMLPYASLTFVEIFRKPRSLADVRTAHPISVLNPVAKCVSLIGAISIKRFYLMAVVRTVSLILELPIKEMHVHPTIVMIDRNFLSMACVETVMIGPGGVLISRNVCLKLVQMFRSY